MSYTDEPERTQSNSIVDFLAENSKLIIEKFDRLIEITKDYKNDIINRSLKNDEKEKNNDYKVETSLDLTTNKNETVELKTEDIFLTNKSDLTENLINDKGKSDLTENIINDDSLPIPKMETNDQQDNNTLSIIDINKENDYEYLKKKFGIKGCEVLLERMSHVPNNKDVVKKEIKKERGTTQKPRITRSMTITRKSPRTKSEKSLKRISEINSANNEYNRIIMKLRRTIVR